MPALHPGATVNSCSSSQSAPQILGSARASLPKTRPREPGTPAILKRGGQRVATLIIYLFEPEAGGATVFPDLEVRVAPVRGIHCRRPKRASKSRRKSPKVQKHFGLGICAQGEA